MGRDSEQHGSWGATPPPGADACPHVREHNLLHAETFTGRRKHALCTENLRRGRVWPRQGRGRASGFGGTNADSEAPVQLISPGKSERLLRNAL